ncbi:hypothetical protein F0L17_12225 [Streptomyces sp. TRM43335]|uniref:Uncharacterized protein n=1 Tax=Streptomyces taklimakanensis TaxID=2569853 RepID=A0A6G2BC85_9ACTN|nr:hypothetical protein [Streptomyces taklimakanensis]MTE19868.1 hypothetical protein [Streptomyces taklimakanensis]
MAGQRTWEQPTGEPTDGDVLAAVGRLIEARGGVADLRALGAVRITRCPVLDCRVTRSLRRRREAAVEENGQPDLSHLPVYEDLDGHLVPPPSDPRVHRVRELLLDGSVRRHGCFCGNGKVPCSVCAGRGRISCEPWMRCAACRGRESCAECGGSGLRRDGRTRTAARLPRSADATGVPRADCALCDAPASACPDCRGRGHGRTVCADCRGKGSQPCPDCDGSGKTDHETCGGKGVRTTWTRGVVEDSPHHEEIRLPEERLPLRVRRRARRRGDWRHAVLAADDPLPDDLAPEHRAAVEPLLEDRPGEVARRVELDHLPLVRVDVVTHPDQVFYVFPDPTRLRVVPVASRRRIRQVTTVALAAALLCSLVLMVALLPR